MERIRKPFQGLWNIIRFNWPYYIISFGLLILGFYIIRFLVEPYQDFAFVLFLMIAMVIIISLLVSFYIYDLSEFYTLNYLNKISLNPKTIINIHAGFDETSKLFKEKYTDADLKALDFYDPIKHTEA
ncbi:MAG TPA: hypothetical protein VK590_12160, partial [Saprospiraceae bacterium]|nr:hypothetical protein [Saprospiraceae bacterium]